MTYMLRCALMCMPNERRNGVCNMQAYTITVTVYKTGNASVMVTDNTAMMSGNGEMPYVICERHNFANAKDAFILGEMVMNAHKASLARD